MCTMNRTFFSSGIAVLAWVVVAAPSAFAQNALTEEGLFVSVASPITSEVVQRIRNQVEPRQNTRPVKTIVFDFNPGGKDAVNVDFGACYGLAEAISKLRANATTVAFVHASVTGHTVLPVLACKEIAMSKEAKIGSVATDGVAPLDDFKRSGYQFLTEDRKAQWAAIRKMFDAGVDLGEGVLKQGGTKWYVDRNNPKDMALIAGNAAEVAGAQPGQVALYTAEQARKIGLCNVVLEQGTRAEVAQAYNLSAASTRADVLNGRTPDAFRYTLSGEVDGAMRESVGRILTDIKRRKGNVLILTLNCSGGDMKAARDLADDLRAAQTGEDAILIIGFIPDAAPDTATFLAFGCSDIVMSRRKDAGDDASEAVLGDFQQMIARERPETIDAHRQSLRELAELRSIPGILVDGMFNKDLVIVRVRAKNGSSRRLMSEAEYEAEKEKWNLEPQVKGKGHFLKLNAARAEELGVSRFTVDTRDPAAVYAYYGLEASRVKEVTPGWLDRFAEFLRLPVVTVLLVVIGFTGLILELKVPGLTVPGIIAALCFILVFWAQSRFSGEMFVLALLLFILGLVLIAMEIFVFPGFGAPGIFGIMCMLAGLGLVTFEKVPQTTAEWGLLGVKVSQFMFGLMGSFVLAFLIAKFLPKVPYANRLMLAPPSGHSGGEQLALPGAEEAAALLGAIGTTNTPLRPAGVVRFGDKFVDVVSDGGFIPAGTRVQVFTVEGTRIVVKEV
jgi:membrane-bound serine protease (ClpP class)